MAMLLSSLAWCEAASAKDPTPVSAPPTQGEAVVRTESPAVSAPLPIDLDFSDDIPVPASRRSLLMRARTRQPAPAPVAEAALAPTSGSRTWIYVTVGLSAMTGGMAWYLHWKHGGTPDPNRTEEVFTDDPD